MIKRVNLRLSPESAANEQQRRREAARIMGVDVRRVVRADIIKRSIDARQRKIFINLTLDIHLDEEDPRDALLPQQPEYRNVADATEVIIVGAGPAGLFAALELLELGLKPVVLERGKDVDTRRRDMAAISRNQTIDPESNYCFGEGGAGAFSDGKLYTRSTKRGPVDKVLQLFHLHGADRDILYDAHPHIGSDKLPLVIKNIRHTIEKYGGKVLFGHRVDDLVTGSDGGVDGVILSDGKQLKGSVILATGHSARDVYEMLRRRNIDMNAKGIAVGVRLEHPQKLIDRIQYHNPQGRGRFLPPAEYSMLCRIDGRAVYSFCMCPGGFIIPAASSSGQLVVNGMSPSNRGTNWANSGMVVEVLPEDIPGDNPLKMLEFQASIEHRFYEAAGHTQQAPAQRMTDFVDGRLSETLPRTSYAPGVLSLRVDQLLPHDISFRLREGFRQFGIKAKGFLSSEAVVIGDETRTSAPVQLPRDRERMEHISVARLYPCGEGAGHAGGIVSAAVDGIKCARALASNILGNTTATINN